MSILHKSVWLARVLYRQSLRSCLGAFTPSMPSKWHSILMTCFKTRPTKEVLF